MVSAIAEGGPLAGDENLKVAEADDGQFPEAVIWKSGPRPNQRHEYRLTDRSTGPQVLPVYTYVRTLPADEE